MASGLNDGYPVFVKNTFIDVKANCVDDELDDSFFFSGVCSRQMTEPAPKINRQCSASAQAVVNTKNTIFEQTPFVSFAGPTSSQDVFSIEPTSADETYFDDNGDDIAPWERLVTGARLSVDRDSNHFFPSEAALDSNSTSNCPISPLWIDSAKPTLPPPGFTDLPTEPSTVVGSESNSGSGELPNDSVSFQTAMMRNLPNTLTQNMLVKELDSGMFVGLYDFLYLPTDKETKLSKGYGFINFIHPSYAWAFKMHYEGQRLPGFTSGKVVSVTRAVLQGRAANLAHYSSARVSRGDRDSRPLFISEGSGCSGSEVAMMAAAKLTGVRRRCRRGARRSLIDMAVRSNHAPGSQMCSRPQQAQQQRKQHHEVANRQQPCEKQFQTEDFGGVVAAMRAGAPFGFCNWCGGKKGPGWNFCQDCGACLMPDDPSQKRPSR